MRLFEEYRFFFILDDRTMPAEQIVILANGRCDQEDPVSQLSTDVRALQAPVDDLMSNGCTWPLIVGEKSGPLSHLPWR
jgi:hypothetical protein